MTRGFPCHSHVTVCIPPKTEPDWPEIARIAGEPVNVQAWKEESKQWKRTR